MIDLHEAKAAMDATARDQASTISVTRRWLQQAILELSAARETRGPILDLTPRRAERPNDES